MPAQIETLKVFNAVIYPLQRHWGADLDTETINDFVNELAEFDDNSLQSAMRKIKREHKKRPTLAHIYDACREYAPAKPSTQKKSQKTFHCMGHAEIEHQVTAREIFDSYAGQMALKAGVGREMMVEYEVSGRTEFDEGFVKKCQGHLQDSIAALRECQTAKNPEAAHYSGIFAESQEREKRLYAKYFRETA